MEPPPYEDPCQNVTWSGDALAGGAADPNCQVYSHSSLPISAVYGCDLNQS